MNETYKVINPSDITKDINNLTYTDYFYRLMLLARSVFKWNNLPNNIDERWIERYLFTEGRCLFYKDPTLGFMVAKCTPSGQINYYDEPTLVTPYGTNYMGNPLENDKECVVIKNNDIMIPTSPTIQLFAMRLTEISRAIDVNIHAQKTPVMIRCSERQKNTLKTIYKQWNGFEPVIFGDKDVDVDNFDVLNTEAPIVFDKLQIQKHAIWNECMTFLGINNANQDKRERLVDDEVQANNEQIELSAHVMLKARERACEMINKIFGTEISVELRNPTELDDEDIDIYSDGSEDGSESNREGDVA